MATPSGPRPSVGPAAMPMVPRPSVGPTTTPIKTPRPSVGFSPQPPTSGRSSGRAGTFRRTLARSPTASRSSLASSPGGAPGDGAEADGEPAAAASYAVEGSLDERLGEKLAKLEGFTTMRAVARMASVMLSRARDARLRLRQRLLDVSSRKKRDTALFALQELLKSSAEDRNVNAIASQLAHLAPSLLEGLPKSSQKRIAAHVRCRTLYRGDLIFEEGDPPTGYFFIAAGSVSIYKRQSAYVDDDVLEEQDEGPEQVWYGSEPARTSALGELIVTLDAGQGFGNFAFSRSGKELRRTASVVSDGDGGFDEAPGALRGDAAASRDDAKKIPPAHFLIIPNKIYVMDISKNADGALQRKITLLESCFLFDSWTIEATYALAREMVIHAYGEEELIFREGDAVSTMLVVCTGELRVHVAYELDELTTLPLDMAVLPPGEIFGLVEAQRRLPVYRASVTATRASEVAMLPLETFRRAVANNARTSAIVQQLAVNRETWETMRMRCASKYREAPPLVLTIAVTASARYLAEPPSLLGKAEARRYDMPFGRIMELRRVSRSSIREAAGHWKQRRVDLARRALERADVTTNGAIDMATKLRNDFGQSAARGPPTSSTSAATASASGSTRWTASTSASAAARTAGRRRTRPATTTRRRKRRRDSRRSRRSAHGAAVLDVKPERGAKASLLAGLFPGAPTRRRPTSRSCRRRTGSASPRRWGGALAGLPQHPDAKLSLVAPPTSCGPLHAAARHLELCLREADADGGEWRHQTARLAEASAGSRRRELKPRRRDAGRSPKEPWDPTKGALEVHRDDESTSAALGRAAVDTFEKLGCVVDAEARGSRARERMRLSTARPYALAVFASRLNAGLGGMRCAEAHRQWEMDHGIAPGHRAHQNLALLPDKEPSDELRRARAARGAAIADLGARKVSDLSYLEQDDLIKIGMEDYERADVQVVVG
ncbi:cAMP-dependent protein kinase regulator [Aureococcus anophagefferens]|nr:cAMP-dependent protein kinase regulator [Aureococcus anophagefferens]